MANQLYQTFSYRHLHSLKWVIGVMGCALFATIIGMSYNAVQEYNRAQALGKAEATRLSAIVAEQIAHQLDTVDLFLQHAIERQHLNLLFGGQLPEDMIHHFKLWVDSRPHMVALMMINEKGQTEIAVNSKHYANWIDYNTSFKDFLPFRLLREDDSELQLLMPYQITNPGYAPEDKRDVLLVARRLSKLDGTFGGMVMAVLSPEYFLDYFAKVDNNHERFIDITMDDGQSLFGHTTHNKYWRISKKSISTILKMKGQALISSATIANTDGRLSIIAYHKLTDLPLTTIVAIDEAEFLYQFWQARMKDVGFLALIVIFASGGAFFIMTMSKQMVRVKKSEGAAILASQTKSEFLANMSHELRTPLNAIIGFSEMLTAGYFGPLNTKQKDRMGDITLCGNHLLQLINDILEFSKGEAGRLEIIEEKVNVFDTVSEAMRIMNEKIKSKQIQFTIDIPPAFPRLFADKRKLKQVLINLISNSVKFTPPHGTVSVKACTDHHGNMVIEVIDTGIGIAEEDIQTALDVFGQVHRSQSHEGTGLGLPLCRMFTELHNGKLTLISALGEGTTVRLQFPETRVIPYQPEVMAEYSHSI